MATSAVSSVSTPGVLVTVMPRWMALCTSILSTPAPNWAIRRSCSPGPRQEAAVDMVGHGRHQHVGGLHRLGQFFLREGVIVLIEAGVEQLLHPQLYRSWQFAGDDDLQLPGRHEHPLYLL
jgi:hypothetical protein